MNTILLDRLCCPECHSALTLEGESAGKEIVEEGTLICTSGRHPWKIIRGIPRFVPLHQYAESFGEQWNRFRKEQLDSQTRTTLSESRFYDVTRWPKCELGNQWVLDAGCGAGRFAEIASAAGAHVVSVDLSSAVDACRDNLKNRCHVVQADLYRLPFRRGSFDRAYSIGVIQHTPRPLEAVRAVSRMVKPGGSLALWIYELNWKSFLGYNAWKYSLRPITRHLGFRANYLIALIGCTLLWPIWFPLIYVGRVGRALLACLPIAAHPYVGKGFRAGHCFRCVVLDTVDMYSPAFDKPQRYGPVAKVLAEEGYSGVTRTCTGLGLAALRSHDAASIAAR